MAATTIVLIDFRNGVWPDNKVQTSGCFFAGLLAVQLSVFSVFADSCFAPLFRILIVSLSGMLSVGSDRWPPLWIAFFYFLLERPCGAVQTWAEVPMAFCIALLSLHYVSFAFYISFFSFCFCLVRAFCGTSATVCGLWSFCRPTLTISVDN